MSTLSANPKGDFSRSLLEADAWVDVLMWFSVWGNFGPGGRSVSLLYAAVLFCVVAVSPLIFGHGGVN
ncbi:unnamed protein product [Prunus armeniaca]